MPLSHHELRALYARRPVLLAPMEDVTDPVYRHVCRELGADLCFTEFVRVDGIVGSGKAARRKLALAPGDQPTAVQIYGSDAELLAEAARIAESAGPAFVDVNCGCWVPRIARGGAGAGWLKDPDAMVAMARRVVERASCPVTVKTRIGFGHEAEMPIVDLARRLEDAGVQAITVHCRTAKMGYEGEADWTHARRVREAVSIPVVVNGDVRSAADAVRALAETGCDAVMVGRRAIEHPWIFREIRAALDGRPAPAPPDAAERLALYRSLLLANVARRGEKAGVAVTRRHLAGFLAGVPGGLELRHALLRTAALATCLELVDRFVPVPVAACG